ncbi:hypothetical protein DEN90_24610 [Escherichia coli]|nr:hypothetical protein DEN90_24610 [Escherichia coli]TFY27779.1 hypothetical protein DEN89_25620 [Escherichia coli]TGG09113.1 hypothetical protein DAH29_03195 [Escherichia coli]
MRIQVLILNSPGGTRNHAGKQYKCSHNQIPSPEGIFTPKNAAYGVEIDSLVLETNVPTS